MYICQVVSIDNSRKVANWQIKKQRGERKMTIMRELTKGLYISKSAKRFRKPHDFAI